MKTVQKGRGKERERKKEKKILTAKVTIWRDEEEKRIEPFQEQGLFDGLGY